MADPPLPPIVPHPHHARRWLARLGGALLAAGAGLLLVAAALLVRDARTGDHFDLVRWEIETLPNRWVALIGRAVHGAPDDDEVVRAYFALPRGDAGRAEFQTALELVVEGRIDAVIREQGIRSRFPLPASVVPPVDIQIAEAPQVLVTSPRAVIERTSADLLRPDLSPARARELEIAAEDGETSALVVPAGGVATYPAIVADRITYEGLLQVAAHEWVHHYLAFYPLGFGYFASADMHTINETVADIIGEEIAALVLERWGDPTRASVTAGAPVTTSVTPAVDLSRVLRELRLEVDVLLVDGQVAEAERRMEEARVDLEAQGIAIRRINQAYFAWYGTYAARPDAVDPLGGYLREIRVRSGSLVAFVELVREIESRAAVEALLVELGGTLVEPAR